MFENDWSYSIISPCAFMMSTQRLIYLLFTYLAIYTLILKI
jgi:hypothetical protein